MPGISKEVQSLRSENSKTFDIGKGKRRLVAHIGAIHYKDNYADLGEQWKDIDLTWVNNRITKAPYEITCKRGKYTIRNKRSGKISTIEPLDTNFEVLPEFSAVKFRYTLSPDQLPFEASDEVTETIKVQSKQGA